MFLEVLGAYFQIKGYSASAFYCDELFLEIKMCPNFSSCCVPKLPSIALVAGLLFFIVWEQEDFAEENDFVFLSFLKPTLRVSTRLSG